MWSVCGVCVGCVWGVCGVCVWGVPGVKCETSGVEALRVNVGERGLCAVCV